MLLDPQDRGVDPAQSLGESDRAHRVVRRLPGDVVEVEISKIGILKNPIDAESVDRLALEKTDFSILDSAWFKQKCLVLKIHIIK